MSHGNEVHQITTSGNSLNGTLITEDDLNNLSNLNKPAPITQDEPDNFSNDPNSITKDESDNLSNINNPASVTQDEPDNFSNNPSNNPPSNNPDSIPGDEPSNSSNLNNPPISEYDQEHNLLNSNDHPSITGIEPDNLLSRRDLALIAEVEQGGPSNNSDRLNLINDQPSHNEVRSMGTNLLKVAISGNSNESMKMLLQDPNFNLLGTTSQGSTCLHISSIFGHHQFSNAVVAENLSLLSSINSYGETPLIVAVTRGHVSLASALLKQYQQLQLSEMIMKQDNNRDTALHHAIRNGHKDLAIKLIEAEPSLAERVNKYDESPMYIAVLRGFNDVSEELLKIPSFSHKGAFHENALHAAVRSGNPDIAKDIVMACPSLAREENESGNTPMHLGVLWNKLDVIRVLLQYDPSLGYLINSHTNAPLLVSAAFRGNIDVAKEILKYCPDAPYCRQDGWTMLHEAIYLGHEAFVEFILETPDQRHNLINRKDINGETALHIAVAKCNPKVVRSLIAYKAILDLTVVSKRGDAPEGSLMSDAKKSAKTLDRNDVLKIMEILDYEGSTSDTMKRAKTLDWTEVLMMMKNANPDALTLLPRQEAKREITEKSNEEIKTLTNTYTNSTSIVAVLIATITFTAAFTLPGGYSNDSGSEGLPVLARKAAFKAFIISDTSAMCSSLAVAFICVIYRWEDRKFLLHYRSLTEKLMWFAYMATTVAFATGLYTVLKPHIRVLAILICLLPIVPFLTYVLGKWPIWKLQYRLGSAYKSDLLDLLDMV